MKNIFVNFKKTGIISVCFLSSLLSSSGQKIVVSPVVPGGGSGNSGTVTGSVTVTSPLILQGGTNVQLPLEIANLKTNLALTNASQFIASSSGNGTNTTIQGTTTLNGSILQNSVSANLVNAWFSSNYFGAPIQYAATTPGVGKIPVSDAVGNMTWTAPQGNWNPTPISFFTNITAGTTNWNIYITSYSSNQNLNISATPINGERMRTIITNTANTNITISFQELQTLSSVWDYQTASNNTAFAVFANSVRLDEWYYLNGKWSWENPQYKIAEVAGAGGITLLTNAAGNLITFSNQVGFFSLRGSGAIQFAEGTGFNATNDPTTQQLNYDITNKLFQIGEGSVGTIQIGGSRIITKGATSLFIGNNGTTNWMFTSAGHFMPITSNSPSADLGQVTNAIRTIYATTNYTKDVSRVDGNGAGRTDLIVGTTTNLSLSATNPFILNGGSINFNGNTILLTVTNDTTSAGPNSVAEFTMPNNTTFSINAYLTSATRGGTNAAAYYGKAGLFNCSNSVATVVGSVQDIFTDIEQIASWGFTMDTSAQLIRFRLTQAGTGTNKNVLHATINPL